MIRSRIIATGAYVPPKVLTNFDLEKIVDTSDAWIISRSGIREHVIKGPDCWGWSGTLGRGGRSRMNVCLDGAVYSVNASRFSWVLHNGPFDYSMFVCHRCDNPPCCNPAHLFLGTVQDNIADKVAKGRGYSPASERSGNLPIGELPVDAVFSPIKRVNWTVGSARVGQSTNYDRLELEIWTDGTISPEKSLGLASMTLIDHLRFVAGISEEALPIGIEKEASLAMASN